MGVRLARNVLLVLFAAGLMAGAFQLAKYLYHRDAHGVRTSMAKQSPANFEEKVFAEERLEDTFLPYANFRRAKLQELLLRDSNLQYADFTGANLDTAGVSGSDFSHAIFHEAKLKNVRWLDSAIFRHASFRGTDLSWVSFHGMGGQHRRSKPKHMLDPSYGGTDMTGAIFEGAVCRHTIFSRCLLTGANFRGSDCREASFDHADLRNADFTNADLRGASFVDADITGAVFNNAKR
jgi:2-iminobutanoate/2-iminopropanoate deaminase